MAEKQDPNSITQKTEWVRKQDRIQFFTTDVTNTDYFECMKASARSLKEKTAFDGWLTKQGGKGIGANWRRRWFILTYDKFLYYYKHPDDDGPLGVICLDNYGAVSLPVEDGKKKFRFSIHNNNKSTIRVFQLYSDSLQESLQWVSTIDQVFKAPKVDNSKTKIINRDYEKETHLGIRRDARLYIRVVEARKLQKTTSCYCIVDMASQQVRTQTIWKSKEPMWSEDFYLDVYGEIEELSVVVTCWKMQKAGKGAALGKVELPLYTLTDQRQHEQWYPLAPANADKYIAGEVHLKIQYKPNNKNEEGKLYVQVIGARNLAPKGVGGTSNPFIRLYLGKKKKKTKTLYKTLAPAFNDFFEFKINNHLINSNNINDKELSLVVYHRDILANQFMGKVTIPYTELEPNFLYDIWYTVADENEEHYYDDDYCADVSVDQQKNNLNEKKEVKNDVKEKEVEKEQEKEKEKEKEKEREKELEKEKDEKRVKISDVEKSEEVNVRENIRSSKMMNDIESGKEKKIKKRRKKTTIDSNNDLNNNNNNNNNDNNNDNNNGEIKKRRKKKTQEESKVENDVENEKLIDKIGEEDEKDEKSDVKNENSSNDQKEDIKEKNEKENEIKKETEEKDKENRVQENENNNNKVEVNNQKNENEEKEKEDKKEDKKEENNNKEEETKKEENNINKEDETEKKKDHFEIKYEKKEVIKTRERSFAASHRNSALLDLNSLANLTNSNNNNNNNLINSNNDNNNNNNESLTSSNKISTSNSANNISSLIHSNSNNNINNNNVNNNSIPKSNSINNINNNTNNNNSERKESGGEMKGSGNNDRISANKTNANVGLRAQGSLNTIKGKKPSNPAIKRMLSDGETLKHSGKTRTPSKIGDIRILLKYTEQMILPRFEYDELFEFLRENNFEIVHLLGEVTNEKDDVGRTLANIFEAKNKAVDLIRSLNFREIDRTENPDVIFRENTLATKTLDHYMKLIGHPYLLQTLGPMIEEIYRSKKQCEVDPSRLEKTDDLQKNLATLTAYVDEAATAIFQSDCPHKLRKIFHGTQEKVKSKYSEDQIQTVKYTAVSGFIFLRFFCPAILGPKLFSLMKEHPDMRVARTLTLIAKTLQNLSNLCEFGYKEVYMADMNKFILEKMPDVKTFIDSISTIPDAPRREESPPIDYGREMAAIHQHFVHSLPAIQEIKDKSEVGEKLAAILKRLEVARNKYEAQEV